MQLEIMNCVIISSAVCYENCNLLLFIWSKPFLLTQYDSFTESTCYKLQVIIPMLEFPFILYYYYLNS